MKKKIGFLNILILICFLFLTGCSSFGDEVTLSSTIELDEKGVVSSEIFQALKEENSVITIMGNDGEVKYSWTVFGSDITEPKDLNMGVSVDILKDESVSIKLETEEDFGFSPVLSLYVPEEWTSKTATVYDSKGNSITGASLTSGNPTIVNFTVNTFGSELVATGDKNPEVAEADKDTSSQGEKVNNKETNNQKGNKTEKDEYLSSAESKKDKYLTDPIPEGKPKPVEPEDTTVNDKKSYTATFFIECSTIFNNLDKLDSSKLEVLPSNGIILEKQTVTFYEGESVYDVLLRLCREKGIPMEASWTPIYNSAYVEGINNLYEFDCGELSGWMYRVNGWYPNYGSSRYQLKAGDVVEWRYTCDLGRDVGSDWDLTGN